MEHLLEKVFIDLKKFKAFEESTLHYTGSMYEGLKIDAVDEFDFMIEMPAFAKAAEITLRANTQMLNFELRQLEFFDDLPIHRVRYDLPSLHEFFSRKSGVVARNEEFVYTGPPECKAELNFEDPNHCFNMAMILNSMGLLIQDCLAHHLLNDWKLVSSESNLITIDCLLKHKSAYTFDIHVKDKIINIDVALCVPIKNLALLFNPKQRTFLPDDFEEKYSNAQTIHHAIIRNSNTLRISLSCQEKEVFNRFDRDDPRKLCVRFMKYLRSKFITHLKWLDDSPFCLVNSYHIKTVFLFMFEIYQDPGDWKGNNFMVRLLEILNVFKSCFEERILESFFIPYYNILNRYFMRISSPLNDADTVVRDLSELIELFDKMRDSEEPIAIFYQKVEEKSKVLIQQITQEHKGHRDSDLMTSHIF